MEGDRQILTVTVVTPEAAVVDRVTCESVTLPTERGEIGILPGHTPLLTLLGIGLVTCLDGNRTVRVAVRDGFAEIAGDQVRILANQAATPEMVDAAAVTLERTAGEARRMEVVGQEQLDAVNADVAYAEARLALMSASVSASAGATKH
ncbi:MAG TPA: ATP synthase F1 subunit epsilon [Thermoanaerobaculia bacterium]|jgi:F-type H+-transporting ATPase subunit epsilon